MVANPFIPHVLVGRRAEFQQICDILAADGDLLLAGVPGSGRRTLLRHAAEVVGSRIIEIDCLRATDSQRFLQLLAEGILATFQKTTEMALIQRWSADRPFVLERSASGSPRLVWHTPAKDEWLLFQSLLSLPQSLAEALNCRVVILFQNFPHIRSWDRSDKWQTYLRQEIQQQNRVSYAIVATVAERWVQHSNMQVVFLGPLADSDIEAWIVPALAAENLAFASGTNALELFLRYVQGHLGDALALTRRLWLERRAAFCSEDPFVSDGYSQLVSKPANKPDCLQRDGKAPGSLSLASTKINVEAESPSFFLLEPHHIHRSALALAEDLSLTYESLLLLLPPSQMRVLESLALDPTSSPHAREYIQKHQLSRGGGLQGALSSLESKGLVYGSEYGYRITMPLLAFWLKHRLA